MIQPHYDPYAAILSTVNRPAPARIRAAGWLALAAAWLLGACVYRIDIQQGNLLEESAVEQIQVGMTRSQVQFLLGTPMVADSFHQDRWDYAYSFRRGRSRDLEQRWVIVYFEGDRVARIEKGNRLNPVS